jgi:hypothetical protein
MKADPIATMTAAHEAEMKQAREEAAALAAKNERERVTGIQSLCAKFGMKQEFQAAMIADEKITLANAAQKVAEAFTPIAPGVGSPISVTKDAADKFRAHASISLMKQAGGPGTRLTAEEEKMLVGHPHVQGFHGLAQECLANEGILSESEIRRLNPSQLADHFIRLAGTSNARMEASSELANILIDASNKVLQAALHD